MKYLIDKDAIVAEIEKIKDGLQGNCNPNPLGDLQECLAAAEIEALDLVVDSVNSLEMKEMDTWHLQEKEDIYDAVKDWELHTFACIMKDRTIQKFTGIRDEDGEGHINVHIDGVNDDYDNVDDIVKWIEFT